MEFPLSLNQLKHSGYYRYLNAHSKGTAATVFLFVGKSGCNIYLSSYLHTFVFSCHFGRGQKCAIFLHVTCRILGSERGPRVPWPYYAKMPGARRCTFRLWRYVSISIIHLDHPDSRKLVLYAVGIVELEFESTSAFLLLLFVIPLAFTLSGFLLWILYSLNGLCLNSQCFMLSLTLFFVGTIAQLRARKQRYKLSMFQRLYRILLLTVVVIVIFFVVSSLTFSGRLAEGVCFPSTVLKHTCLRLSL